MNSLWPLHRRIVLDVYIEADFAGSFESRALSLLGHVPSPFRPNHAWSLVPASALASYSYLPAEH